MPIRRLLAAFLFAPIIGASGPPRPVRVVVIELHSVASTLTYSGTVQARTQADLGFQVGGKVVARPVDVGAHVRAGDVLARLDEADLQLATQAALAALQAAAADAASRRADLARYEQLGRKSAAYLPSEYDKRIAASRMADARATQAARQYSLAQSQRAYSVLAAGADGVVTAAPVEVGQVVAPGQTVATVAFTDAVDVAVDVPENQLAAVRAAEKAKISLWAAPETTLHGRVREMGALADAASGTFAVKVGIDDAPPGLLAFGMTATVRFGAPGPPVATLPATALTDQDGSPAVWVLDTTEARASLRPVQVTGYSGDGDVLVGGGLHDGETVVTAGVGQIGPEMALTAWRGTTR